jgi:hypothetical protein
VRNRRRHIILNVPSQVGYLSRERVQSSTTFEDAGSHLTLNVPRLKGAFGDDWFEMSTSTCDVENRVAFYIHVETTRMSQAWGTQMRLCERLSRGRRAQPQSVVACRGAAVLKNRQAATHLLPSSTSAQPHLPTHSGAVFSSPHDSSLIH